MPTLLLNCEMVQPDARCVKAHSNIPSCNIPSCNTYVGQVAVCWSLGQYLFLVQQLGHKHGVVENDDLGRDGGVSRG